MDKATGKKIVKLRGLARLDVDAIGTYDAAIAKVEAEEVRLKLSEFRLDHVRHVQDLNALLVKLGGDQVAMEPDLKGAVLKTATTVGSMLGTEGALVSMMGNEGLTNLTYELALKAEWNDEERAVIEKNRADEKVHINWIKDALVQRVWHRRPQEANP